MEFLSLFILALLAIVKTSPPDIHSRDVSSIENGRYSREDDEIVYCNSRFIHCSEQKSVCENVEGINTKEYTGSKTITYLCDNKKSVVPYSSNNKIYFRYFCFKILKKGPRGTSTVQYSEMDIRFINCTPLSGNNMGTLVDLTEGISEYYIDDGKNYITANNKKYVCESRYADKVMQFRHSSCSGDLGTAECP
ncbi:expressed protein [Phakopsora pachyrhizi]|uniref:Expressed protein n=1 Tax=Phakopsora pachyrhizi TaxID=170000 RepID=A0AAV0B271_PHAPC|nr:expressed protein [Phakopsora pachyrhizi]